MTTNKSQPDTIRVALDETVWQKWIEKNRASEVAQTRMWRKRAAVIMVLLAVAVLFGWVRVHLRT